MPAASVSPEKRVTPGPHPHADDPMSGGRSESAQRRPPPPITSQLLRAIGIVAAMFVGVAVAGWAWMHLPCRLDVTLCNDSSDHFTGITVDTRNAKAAPSAPFDLPVGACETVRLRLDVSAEDGLVFSSGGEVVGTACYLHWRFHHGDHVYVDIDDAELVEGVPPDWTCWHSPPEDR